MVTREQGPVEGIGQAFRSCPHITLLPTQSTGILKAKQTDVLLMGKGSDGQDKKEVPLLWSTRLSPKTRLG